ncbi:hypothetical protein CMI39_02480 [Candidatus Pacearchaeota archaeon]|jgi:sulfoxide reductase heme-binding subunit YedZ|nr:hypothetical protein [Candidatus Pacearchaeota archaeon]|tara:strand:- start:9775 stop:10494 length:720 start_codon:yes stop_codon:yes gene_type:complete
MKKRISKFTKEVSDFEDKINKYIKRESDWFVAFAIGAILFFAFLYYHYIRRGIINPFSPNDISFLFLANKAVAISAVFLIGISFLLGSLAKFFTFFKEKVKYRKEIGLLGFFFALIHIVIVYFFLQDKFPRTWFIENPIAVVFGILSLITLVIVAFISNNYLMKKLSYKKWIFIQRLAYLAFILAALHILFLGKIPGWINWVKTLEPLFPPGTLVTISFIIIVLLIRISVIFLDKKERK